VGERSGMGWSASFGPASDLMTSRLRDGKKKSEKRGGRVFLCRGEARNVAEEEKKKKGEGPSSLVLTSSPKRVYASSFSLGEPVDGVEKWEGEKRGGGKKKKKEGKEGEEKRGGRTPDHVPLIVSLGDRPVDVLFACDELFGAPRGSEGGRKKERGKRPGLCRVGSWL